MRAKLQQLRKSLGYRNDPRKNHMDMDGQRVPKDKPFELRGIKGGTYYPMCPRDTNLPPEESINCHCISHPVVSAEVLGLSLEERQRLQQEAIKENKDIASTSEVFERMESRVKIAGTDIGSELQHQVDDLKALLHAYRMGEILEDHRG